MRPTFHIHRSRAAVVTAAITALAAVTASAPASAASSFSPAVQVTSWSARYHGSGSFNQPSAMAVSPDGATLYVTGESLGKGGGTNGTVAYSAATGAVRWRDINTMGAGSALVVSPDGSTLYVTGGGGTIAYNAATGARRWASTAVAGDTNAISPDGSTLYVSGAVDGPHGWEYSTSGYDAADGSSLWTTLWNRTGTSLGDQIKLSPDGATLYLSGWTGGDSNTVAAYHTPDGSLAWQQSWHSPGGQAAPLDLAVNPDGSAVYVTGLDTPPGSQDIWATLAYDAGTGARRWLRYDRRAGDYGIFPQSIAVSPDGSAVYVTGRGVSGTGKGDFTTFDYSAATGATVWTQRYGGRSGGNGGAAFDGVSPDGSTVFVTGTPVSGGYATLGYNAATGAQQWVRRYTPPGGAGIITGAVNPVTDQVFVTGTSRGRTDAQQYATVAYTVTG